MAYALPDRLMPSQPISPSSVPYAEGCPEAPPSGAPWVAVESRLAELAALPADWNDDGAPPISATALRITRQLFLARPPLIGLGDLFPSPDGGVLLEYIRGTWDLTVEVSANGTLEIFGFEIGGTLRLYPKPYPGINAEFLRALDTAGGPAWR
jgi:hypothetical protein